MDIRKVQCHGCKLYRERNIIIQCSKKECHSCFCLFCFEEKYGMCSYPQFLNKKTNNKWKCFKCKKVCVCNECLNEIKLNNSGEYKLLKKKKDRFKKKFQKSKLKEDDNINRIQKEFPNFKRNKILNKLIIRAGIISHILKIYKVKKFSNKPCLVCNKFKCPKKVEILKFKSIDEVRMFLETFFIEFEDEMKRGNMCSNLSKILEQKNNLDKVKEILDTVPCEERLRIPKRICSNCFSSLLFEQNGLINFSDLFKEEDEVSRLNVKQKLEIINGIYNLIEKEAKKKMSKKESLCIFLNNLQKPIFQQNNQTNVFNSILNYNKLNNDNIKNELTDNFKINNNKIYKEIFPQKEEIVKSKEKENFDCENELSKLFSLTKKLELNHNIHFYNSLDNNSFVYNNIYYLLLNKISMNASEVNHLLIYIQNKLFEYMYTQNSNSIINEIILINELLKMKSNTIKDILYDYNRELLKLQNYLYINQS